MSWQPRCDLYGDLLGNKMITRFGSSRFRAQDLAGLAISPDDRLVACGARYGVVIWKATTGKLLFEAGSRRINALAFSPTGEELLSAGKSGVIRLWSMAEGRSVGSLKVQGGDVYAVAFSQDGERFVSGGGGPDKGDRLGRLWDLKTNNVIAELKGARQDIGSVAFSDDDRWVAIASDNTVRLYDGKKGHQGPELQAPSRAVGVDFGAEGAAYVVCSGGQVLRFPLPAEDATIVDLKVGLCSVAVSPTGSMVAVGAEDGTFFLLRNLDLGLMRRVVAHSAPVTDLIWSGDGRALLSLSRGGTGPRLWAPETGHRIIKGEGHEGPTQAVCASNDGSVVVTMGGDDKLILWDEAGRVQRYLSVPDSSRVPPESWRDSGSFHRRRPSCIALSDDGNYLFAGFGGRLLGWEGPTAGGEVREYLAVDGGVTRVVVDSGGKHVLAAHPDGYVVMEVESGGSVVREKVSGPVVDAVFVGTTVMVACNGDQVRRWNLNNGKFLESIKAKKPFDVGPAALSADGSLGAIDEGVWDTETGEMVAEFKNEYAPMDLAFSPDGRYLALSFVDGSIWVRDLKTRGHFKLFGHQGAVRALHWGPSGLYSAGDDCTAVQWDTSP